MDERLELRRVDVAELDWLAAVDPRLAGDTAHRRHIGALLASGLSWAAFDGEAAVGFAIVTRHFFGFPFVDLLVVAEAQRRRGIGVALMARCEAAHDADRIFTSTNESNAPMRQLLATAGWSPSGQVDNLDPGDPELFFVKFRAPK